MSLIAGTLRNISSVINPSSLQCLENSDCSASPSDAGGYSTGEDEDEVAAAMDVPARRAMKSGTEKELRGPSSRLGPAERGTTATADRLPRLLLHVGAKDWIPPMAQPANRTNASARCLLVDGMIDGNAAIVSAQGALLMLNEPPMRKRRCRKYCASCALCCVFQLSACAAGACFKVPGGSICM